MVHISPEQQHSSTAAAHTSNVPTQCNDSPPACRHHALLPKLSAITQCLFLSCISAKHGVRLGFMVSFFLRLQEGASAAQSHAPLPQLPEQLVSQVLRYLHFRERLDASSLVCRAWRSAAAAATDDVYLWLVSGSAAEYTAAKLDSLQQWLSRNGAAVTHVTVVQDHNQDIGAVVRLPFPSMPQLQKLDLFNCQLQEQPQQSAGNNNSMQMQRQLLPQQQQQQQQTHLQAGSSYDTAVSNSSSSSSSSSSQVSLSSLTNLTSLRFDRVVYSLRGGIAALSALTGLQQLRLHCVSPVLLQSEHIDEMTEQRQAQQLKQQQQGIMQCLAALTPLTAVEIVPELLPEPAIAPFGKLSQLRELNFRGGRVAAAGILVGLQPSLTQLQLLWDAQESLSSSTCSSLAGLTAMQQFEIYVTAGSGGIVPDFCGSWQQLRVLSLEGKFGADGVAALLAVMPSFSRLESCIVTADVQPQLPPPADVARYASLLPPSQHLTRLEVSWRSGAGILAPGCGEYMFAADRQLPSLKQLILGVPYSVWEGLEGPFHYADQVDGVSAVLGIGDVARLAACCPALQQLIIAGVVQPNVDMRPLSQLTALTHLCIGGDAVDYGVTSSALGQLTGLKTLEIYASPGLDDLGVLQLTALTGLTRLVAVYCGTSEGLSEEDGYIEINTQVNMLLGLQ
jgi:hypothetical protein